MAIVISAAGSMTRTGTTTQCLQLCRFLKETGYRAAYLECNLQNYIAAVAATYTDAGFSGRNDHLEFAGISMYAGEYLGSLRRENSYDFLVCDYGNLRLRSFDADLFCRGDACLVTGGVKPGEIEELTRVLADPSMQDVIYLLSFVPKGDVEMIRALLEDRSAYTLFSPYLPDPFGTYTGYYGENGYFYTLMDLVLSLAEQKKHDK